MNGSVPKAIGGELWLTESSTADGVLVVHDEQLAAIPRHRYLAAWDRLQRFVVALFDVRVPSFFSSAWRSVPVKWWSSVSVIWRRSAWLPACDTYDLETERSPHPARSRVLPMIAAKPGSSRCWSLIPVPDLEWSFRLLRTV